MTVNKCQILVLDFCNDMPIMISKNLEVEQMRFTAKVRCTKTQKRPHVFFMGAKHTYN